MGTPVHSWQKCKKGVAAVENKMEFPLKKIENTMTIRSSNSTSWYMSLSIQAAVTADHRLGDSQTTEVYFSRSKVWVSEIRVLHDQVLGRTDFWPQTAGCSIILTRQKPDSQLALWPLLLRALITFMRALTSWPNYHPKAPPPNTISLRLELQHMYLEDTNIQSRAVYIHKNCKQDLEAVFPQPCSVQHYSQSPRGESNLHVHRRRNGSTKWSIHTQENVCYSTS